MPHDIMFPEAVLSLNSDQRRSHRLDTDPSFVLIALCNASQNKQKAGAF